MSELLKHLAYQLAEIRESNPTEPLSIAHPRPELADLISIPSATIKQYLGDPCGAALWRRPSNEWVYLFHKLPPGWRGGGAELHLTFGADGCCESATWKSSR